MLKSIHRLVGLTLTLVIAGCLPVPADAQSPTVLKRGRWAQSYAVFRNLDFVIDITDFCFGRGTFDGPIMLDPEGRFDQEGDFKFNIPVPEAPTFRVRYVGQVRSGTIALTILSLDEEHPLVRTYVLRNKAKRLHKPCPESSERLTFGPSITASPPN